MSTTPSDSLAAPLPDPLETILRLCAAAAPEPWYPKAYAQQTGISRDGLDPYLQELRLGGWIQLTEWVRDLGQGYRLTPRGTQLLQDPAALARLKNGPAASPEMPTAPEAGERDSHRSKTVRAALTSTSTPVVSATLLLANIAVFLAGLYLGQREGVPLGRFFQLMSNDPRLLDILRLTGAVDLGLIREGEWWRLLTACFVHFGAIHLGVNMYVLYQVGPLLERMWGHGRFLLIYLIAGLGGSCAQLIFSPSALLAGASGAIWGVMASLAVWIALNRAYLPSRLVALQLRQLTFIFFLNVFISLLPGIGAAAHFGGGVVGAVVALLLNVQRFGQGTGRRLALAGVLATPVLCVATLVHVRHLPLPLPAGGQRPDEEVVIPEGALQQRELDPFTKRYLATAERSHWAAAAAYRNQVEPLLEQKPEERDRNAVRQALVLLERERNQLIHEAGRLKQAGPAPEEQVDKARRACVRLLEEQARLLELSARCLEEGGDLTDADALDRQKQQLKRAQEGWERSLKRLPEAAQ